MVTELKKLLEKTEPFSSFSDDIRDELLSLARQKTYAEGEFVTLSGDLWPRLILVQEGEFHAVKESSEGRSLVVLSITSGDVVWGLTFFDTQSVMPISLLCGKPGSITSWTRDDVLPLLVANGEALWSLCGLLVERMKQASDIVDSLAFQPVAGRMAQLLLNRYGDKGEDPVARDLTLDAMAAYVGTTSEVVCRILYRFSDENLIQITRTEFSIEDRDGLAKYAQQE
jgi:CRP/FNR family transcriptional regulator